VTPKSHTNDSHVAARHADGDAQSSLCGVTPPEALVNRFIDEDREVRAHGC